METVYIESTIISYLVSRPSRDIIVVARQDLTRQWWDHFKPSYECVISQVVLDEIAAGNPEVAALRLARVEDLPILAVDPACVALASQYLGRGFVPESEVRDAFHIALAVIGKADYLLTWNCKHIANAHAVKQLRKFTESQGHEFPHICTPEEL